MGTHLVIERRENYLYREHQYRLVYWDDGTIWNENASFGDPPRLLKGGEIWITEAYRQFQEMLAAGIPKFTIDFTDVYRSTGTLEKM